jgi:sulfofructosephosphate aldolase
VSTQVLDSTPTEQYAALARSGGAFAMLALDQRVSLETMFEAAGLAPDESELDAFRIRALRALLPHASAVLLETGFLSRGGAEEVGRSGCGRIVAVDRLQQVRGHPVQDSELDVDAVPVAVSLGAHALKLLVVWTPGGDNAKRIATVQAFVGAAHAHDRLALVEGIVQADPRTGSAASSEEYLHASVALAEGCDVYKAQVPVHGGSDAASVAALARELTDALACPWVVLSTGVRPDEFENAVAASCRGGASGFLAGRAIWAPALTTDDQARYLEEVSVPRLNRLGTIVDAEARPWTEALDANGRATPSRLRTR